MTKQLLLLAALNLLTISAFAQVKPPQPEQNDPEAKKLLDKIRKKYEGYKTLEVAFSLTTELPGQAKDVQKGSIAQAAEKFRLDMDAQTIISDGKTTWVYLKKENEVQINDAGTGDESAFLTPKELLSRYQRGDYTYAITEKTTEGGKPLTYIEFKPKDKNSEYAKIRLTLDTKANTIESIKAFAKDGGRFTFKITKLVPNKKFPAGHFLFDKAKFPGVRVEDLRM
ncbi:MAG: LolA family protein [Saprospiraceae bacterium]